jgi:DNA invertase Pin-like site-specific DNA recombinase
MNFGIYTRKSYYSDTSESTKMQYDACKEYIMRSFPEPENVIFYEDDGYVRSNIDRPGMNQMKEDIADGLIDCVVIYRIDRITSKMDDFCIFYGYLKNHGVKFVTVKDGIDTNTPIGEAMMYLAVIFSSIEVQNDSLRITDNLRHLASSGYWCGGQPPLGYKIEPVLMDGSKKSHKILVPDEKGKAFVKKLISLFLERGCSLTSLATYCRNNGIVSPVGTTLSSARINTIIRNPQLYAGTERMFDYFENLGCIMDEGSPREKWDGSRAPLVYGRTMEVYVDNVKRHRQAPPERWRISLAQWEPLFNDDLFFKIMKQYGRNRLDRKMKYETTLLKGVLRCKCGRLMGLARKKRVDGSVLTEYICTRRNIDPSACRVPAIPAKLIDDEAMKVFKSIHVDPFKIKKYVKTDNLKSHPANPERLRKELAAIERKIDRLTLSLSENGQSSAAKYIVKQIEALDIEAGEIRAKISAAALAERRNARKVETAGEKIKLITKLCQHLEEFSIEEQNELAKKVLKSAVWDGETLSLEF